MAFKWAGLVFLVIWFFGIVIDFSTFSVHWETLGWFLDVPSFILVVVPSVVLARAATSSQAAKRSWQLVFRAQMEVTQQDAHEASHYLHTLGNLALWMGALGVLVEAIIIFQNFDSFSECTVCWAVALITLFYGIVIKVVCIAACEKIKNRYLTDWP